MRFGSVSPAIAVASTWRKLRRFTPEQRGRYSFPMCNMVGGPFGSDRVGNRFRDIDVLALGELAVLVLLVIQVVKLLEHDLVFPRRRLGMFKREVQARAHGRDFLAVTAHLPLQARAPVVGDLG